MFIPDGLLSLCLSNLRLLISLSHDVIEGGTSYSTLELCRASATFLGHLFLLTLLVLTTVQHGPINLTGITLHQVGFLTLAIDEVEGLHSRKKSK